MLSPVPEFIAAVIPTTRGSRRTSSTIASPKTCVYCGGAVLDAGLDGTRGAGDDRARLGGVPALHALQAALLGRGEALALHGGDVDDDGPVGRQRLAQRAPQARGTSWPSMTPV